MHLACDSHTHSTETGLRSTAEHLPEQDRCKLLWCELGCGDFFRLGISFLLRRLVVFGRLDGTEPSCQHMVHDGQDGSTQVPRNPA